MNIYKIGVLLVALQIATISYNFAQPKVEINSAATSVEVDNLDNIYVVNQTELVKYSSSGKFLYRFSNQINGLITSIDVTNPLRIVLFCRESNTITFLNQQLSPITESIDIFNTMDVEAINIGASTAGDFWIYSADNQNIILFNRQLKVEQESQNLSYWIQGDTIKQMRELNQKLYLVLPQRVVVLDLFGSYLTTIHFNNSQDIKISTNKLSYTKGNKLFVFNLLLNNEIEKTIPIINKIGTVFYNKNNIYVITDDKVQVF